MSMRRKTVEVMSLLYEAAKKTQTAGSEEMTSVLNPTTGVRRRNQDMFQKVVFQHDESRPGHGMFVAKNIMKESEVPNDLPPGLLVVAPAKTPTTTNKIKSKQQGDHDGAGDDTFELVTNALNESSNLTFPNFNINPMLNMAGAGDPSDDASLMNLFDTPVSVGPDSRS